ncbi:MAG: hypothetical protein L7U72_14795 [Rubripirellula sp.]|nr:hypothetical protein [Rubripirellula sp.]
MFEGSLVLGATLCLFAGWLHRTEQRGWPNETFHTELDQEYRVARLRSRRRINFLIAVCGVLILIAAFASPGNLWAICWILVMMGLVLVVFLAGVDAFRTHRYHQRKLPEIRKQSFGDDES